MKELTAAQVAEMVNGEVLGNPERIVNKVASLKEADEFSCGFVGNKKYEHQLTDTKAAVVLVCKDLVNAPLNGRTHILCDSCDISFSKIIEYFAPEAVVYPVGIHPTASVHPTAKLGENVSIGPCAVIEEGVEIGDNTIICGGCYIGHFTTVGKDCKFLANTTVSFRCKIGNKVILNSGCVIGCDGFGFLPTKTGLVKVPQTGIVQIDDDVEIGANTTVDRARFGKTWIKTNVKVDNLVMVAHNVVVGESSILIAQCGIAGSAEIGKGVILAAKSGVNGHITVGDGTQLAGTSSLAKSCAPGSILLGTPAESQRDFMGRVTLPKKVDKLKTQLSSLEAKIAELEAKLAELSK